MDRTIGQLNEVQTNYRLNDIDCSNCRKRLGAIVVKESESLSSTTTKIIVKCPFCGDKSFLKEIVGKFHFGAIDGTAMIGSSEIEGVFIINLQKN